MRRELAAKLVLAGLGLVEKSERTLSEPVVRDFWLLRCLRPRVGVRVGIGPKEMQRVTGFALGETDVASFGPTLAAVRNLLEPLLERGEVAIAFEVELEF